MPRPEDSDAYAVSGAAQIKVNSNSATTKTKMLKKICLKLIKIYPKQRTKGTYFKIHRTLYAAR